MRATFELFPSPLMGEGSGGGEDRISFPPSQPSPAEGGRGIDLPLSAYMGGFGWGWEPCLFPHPYLILPRGKGYVPAPASPPGRKGVGGSLYQPAGRKGR
jgi:hypothetical protein